MQSGYVGYPLVGSLYKSPVHSGIVTWVQPGGIGTQVFPAQHPGQLSALYILGCGHAANCLTVFKDKDLETGELIAVVCCPACTYTQAILNYDDYQNYELNPLLVV